MRHLKAVTGDLDGRRPSSARRNARTARPRNHCRIRPAARCALQAVRTGLGRDDGSARTAAARGRVAQLFAGFAHRGARLYRRCRPEHEAVIDTVRGRQCAVLNFPAQNSSFLRRGSYSAVIWAGSRARRWIGPHCNGSWACRAAIRGLRSSRRACRRRRPRT